MRRQTGIPLRVRPSRDARRSRDHQDGIHRVSRLGFQVQGTADRAGATPAVRRGSATVIREMAMPLSRRRFLRNMSMTGAVIRVGLPPLAVMFNSNGTAYAAAADAAVQPRFVFWFNGNGIPERYWIPREVGSAYELT